MHRADQKLELEFGLSYQLRPGTKQRWFILVHGRAGNFQVMGTFARVLPPNALLILPQAHLPDALGGFSWWDMSSSDQVVGRAQTAADKLELFILKCAAHYQLSLRGDMVAIGFSQGGALISVLLQRRPELFAGFAGLASFSIAIPNPTPLNGLPIFIGHGSQDQVVAQRKAEESIEYWRGLGAEVQTIFEPVGHKVGAGTVRQLGVWATQHST